jgi:hypothetical protein
MAKGSRAPSRRARSTVEDRPVRTPSLTDRRAVRRTVTPSEQWARLAVAGITSTEPLSSVDDWAVIVRCSSRTLWNRCNALGVTPKRSVDFMRLLRIVLLRERGLDVERWTDEIEDIDTRTHKRLARTMGTSVQAPIPDLPTYLASQQFVTAGRATLLVSQMLRDWLTRDPSGRSTS